MKRSAGGKDGRAVPASWGTVGRAGAALRVVGSRTSSASRVRRTCGPVLAGAVRHSISHRWTCWVPPGKPCPRSSRQRTKPFSQPSAKRCSKWARSGSRMLGPGPCGGRAGKVSARAYLRTVPSARPVSRAIPSRVLPARWRHRTSAWWACHRARLCAGGPSRDAAPECPVAAGRRRWFTIVGRHRQAPQPGFGAVRPAFDRLAHVGQQVPAVGGLHGLGGAQGKAAGVVRRAVAGDSLDAWAAPKPLRQGPSGPVRQQVQHAAALQVHDNGAVWASLADRPLVYANPARRLQIWQRQPADQAQHGVRARRHGQVVQQSEASVAAIAAGDPFAKQSVARRPEGATPTRACAAASRQVRRACGATSSGSRSAKMRRAHLVLRQ